MENAAAKEPLKFLGGEKVDLILSLNNGKVEMLRISPDGFWVRGQKVPDADAPRVCEAFKSWLWKANIVWSVAPQEEGWLIENGKHTVRCLCVGENWGVGEQRWCWVDPGKAVRFARESDAMVMARILQLDPTQVRFVCHGWETTDISE